MAVFNNMRTKKKIKRLKEFNLGECISYADIVELSVDLKKAEQNLSSDNYYKIKTLYDSYLMMNDEQLVFYEDYLEMRIKIAKDFNSIASYQLYGKGDSLDQLLIEHAGKEASNKERDRLAFNRKLVMKAIELIEAAIEGEDSVYSYKLKNVNEEGYTEINYGISEVSIMADAFVLVYAPLELISIDDFYDTYKSIVLERINGDEETADLLLEVFYQRVQGLAKLRNWLVDSDYHATNGQLWLMCGLYTCMWLAPAAYDDKTLQYNHDKEYQVVLAIENWENINNFPNPDFLRNTYQIMCFINELNIWAHQLD